MTKLIILNSHASTPAFVDSLVMRGATLTASVFRLPLELYPIDLHFSDPIDSIVCLSIEAESSSYIEELASGIANTIEQPIPVYFDYSTQTVDANLAKPGDYIAVPLLFDQVALYQLPKRLQSTKLLSGLYPSTVTPKGAEESFTYDYCTHDGIPGWKIKMKSGYEITGIWDELFLHRDLKLDPMVLHDSYFGIDVPARVTMVDHGLLESVLNRLKEYGIEFPNT